MGVLLRLENTNIRTNAHHAIRSSVNTDSGARTTILNGKQHSRATGDACKGHSSTLIKLSFYKIHYFTSVPKLQEGGVELYYGQYCSFSMYSRGQAKSHIICYLSQKLFNWWDFFRFLFQFMKQVENTPPKFFQRVIVKFQIFGPKIWKVTWQNVSGLPKSPMSSLGQHPDAKIAAMRNMHTQLLHFSVLNSVVASGLGIFATAAESRRPPSTTQENLLDLSAFLLLKEFCLKQLDLFWLWVQKLNKYSNGQWKQVKFLRLTNFGHPDHSQLTSKWRLHFHISAFPIRREIQDDSNSTRLGRRCAVKIRPRNRK